MATATRFFSSRLLRQKQRTFPASLATKLSPRTHERERMELPLQCHSLVANLLPACPLFPSYKPGHGYAMTPLCLCAERMACWEWWRANRATDWKGNLGPVLLGLGLVACGLLGKAQGTGR